ncbi:hypothetical protein [Halomicronema sp. CCY15110]|uniref:hypothetical protein n=1 Tax=Halomicronema sp. CCY15110 TaxID=2767773 RepID=UPI00194F8E25|nr:hypothetical protein [Halomicronema sp. CCY15110]
MAANDIAHLQAVLARVFEFSPADLAANRMGMISDAQKARMTHTYDANCRMAWVIFALIFGLGFLGFSADMIRNENLGVDTVLIYFGVTACWGLIVWAFILYHGHQLQRTLRQGNVQPVAGQIQLWTERSEGMRSRYFCVGGYKFRMDNYTDFSALQKSGIAGRAAILYVSYPNRSLLSVLLQA